MLWRISPEGTTGLPVGFISGVVEKGPYLTSNKGAGVKLKNLYELAVNKGIEQDPRGKTYVKGLLNKAKKEYESLDKKEKEFFNKVRLFNPYSDTRILNGSGEEDVKSVLVGIDIDVGEVLLADRLNSKAKKVDLIIAHHPEGAALAALHRVMYMQADLAHNLGVPVTVADSLLGKRIDEVERRLMPINHMKTVDAARLLDLPLMCIHTAADNCVTSFLQKLLDRKRPETNEEILNILNEVPEYKISRKNNAGPKLINGPKSARSGKIVVDMTGGTEGAKDIFGKLSAAGVGTLVCMHLSEEHLKKAREAHINVIIAGHISSDNIGLNIVLDEIEKKQALKVICCSGFTRIKRVK